MAIEDSTTPTADAVQPAEGATAPLDTGPNTQVDESERLEEKTVEDLANEWKQAREFDSPAYNQVARDRKYVAGTDGADWAVNANLLGSYIDILVSFIYARNPKVSVRPAEQTGQAAQSDRQNFAKTLQIVITRLWLSGKLKKAMKRVVRSAFSVSTGWFKASMLMQTELDPIVQHELEDVQDALARIGSLEARMSDVDGGDPIDKEVAASELKLQLEALESKVEMIVGYLFAIDFCPCDQVQVSLDVRDIDDYLAAGWVGDEIFVKKTELAGRFPRLKADDLKRATVYYQRSPTEYSRYETVEGAAGGDIGIVGAPDPHGEASAYTTNMGAAGMRGSTINDSSGKPVEYAKIVETWDKRDQHIKTRIEGVKKWAKLPYQPQFVTARFYPYFYVDFFPVDGERWPQSLTFRLAKLQDEYAGTRSSFRLTRQRAIPGTIVNGTQVEAADLDKIRKGTQDEYIVITPRDQEADMNKLFAAKPMPTIDPRLFDTAPIVGDMEKISGVQEALQTSQTMVKTATQADIEQQGFSARSTSERDCVEDTLTEFAVYTAQLALQALTHNDVVKMAGPLAFWPEGLPTETITTLLDIEIEAGSTGRPNATQERDAWTTLLPLLTPLIEKIYAMQAAPIAQAYIEILRETFSRFDDRIDVERFLPGIKVGAQNALPPDPMLGGRGPNGLMLPPPDGGGMPGPGAGPAQPGQGGVQAPDDVASTDPQASPILPPRGQQPALAAA